MRVTLNGIVASDDDQEIYDWFGIGAFSPKTVRQALADNPQGEELVLEINSPGGSVFAGGEIYSVLRSSEGVWTRAEIQSLAASAASYLCLGCSEVAISPVAMMMLHLPATSTRGGRVENMGHPQRLLNPQRRQGGPERAAPDDEHRDLADGSGGGGAGPGGQRALSGGDGPPERDERRRSGPSGPGLRGRPGHRAFAGGVPEGESRRSTQTAGSAYMAGQGPFGPGKNQILRRSIMKASLRQKLMDMAKERGDFLSSAEVALEEGRQEDFNSAMEKVTNLNGEMGRIQALIQEQDRKALEGPAPGAAEVRDMAEERGALLMKGEEVTFSVNEVRRAVMNETASTTPAGTTLATGSLAEPTGAGSNIRDPRATASAPSWTRCSSRI